MWHLKVSEVWKKKEKKKKKKKKEITQSKVQTKTMNGKLGRHAKSCDVSPNLQQKPARYLGAIHFFQINLNFIGRFFCLQL